VRVMKVEELIVECFRVGLKSFVVKRKCYDCGMKRKENGECAVDVFMGGKNLRSNRLEFYRMVVEEAGNNTNIHQSSSVFR
jgi:hypothetical protein